MKKLINRTTALLLTLLLTVGLAACSNDSGSAVTTTPEATETTETTEAVTESTESAETAEATSEATDDVSTESQAVTYPLTITDSYGVEITIESEPEVVISCAPNITEIIYALGAENTLAGRTDYCNYPPEVSGIESIGTLKAPDVERIIELQPDLVIASTHFDEENAALLEEAGVTVLGLYESDDFDGSYSLVERVGQALNCVAEADAVVAEMKATVDEVTAAVDGLDKPSVYYVVGYGEYGDYTAGGDTFIGQLLEMAGGDNIAKEVEGWSYNLESLLEADPEYIILADGLGEAFSLADGYKDLTAVKEGRVYEIDENMLVRQGVRNAEGLRVVAEILHPEAFAE